MCVCKLLLRISLSLLLVLLLLAVPGIARSKNEDFDYYNDDGFDPNWIYNYDPWENPPCDNWNPLDGCGRTPARTKPASTTATPNEQTTPLPQAHTTRFTSGGRLECTLEETREAACLHGGECFALDLLETRSPYCQCLEMWRGNRCEEMDPDLYGNVITADKVEKASIAAGVVVLIIVITVIIVYLVVRKRKQRKNRAQSNGNANGHAGKALMGSEKEPVDGDDAEKCTDV